MNQRLQKSKHAEIQQRLEETFPVIASGNYVRHFNVSSICWPLNWTYEGHKQTEKISWEYRSNSERKPMFLYRETYSCTTIQATFIINRANKCIHDISISYLDQEQLTHNQEQILNKDHPEFVADYLIIQPRVDEGDMLRKLCKFDRKLSLALADLKYLREQDSVIPKIPIERMVSHVRQYLAIPFINQTKCCGQEIPSESEILKYAGDIWDKIIF